MSVNRIIDPKLPSEERYLPFDIEAPYRPSLGDGNLTWTEMWGRKVYQQNQWPSHLAFLSPSGPDSGDSETGDVTLDGLPRSSVAGLSIHDCTLWVLRQTAGTLSLAAYTVCLGQDNEVKVSNSQELICHFIFLGFVFNYHGLILSLILFATFVCCFSNHLNFCFLYSHHLLTLKEFSLLEQIQCINNLKFD